MFVSVSVPSSLFMSLSTFVPDGLNIFCVVGLSACVPTGTSCTVFDSRKPCCSYSFAVLVDLTVFSRELIFFNKWKT